jgi:hypothetical protein
VVPDESKKGHHLDGEEVHSYDGTKMGLDEFRPRHPLPSNRRWIAAVFPQNPLDCAASDCVAEIHQCAFAWVQRYSPTENSDI